MNAQGISVDVVDYRPSAELDAEIAELCYAALRGAPDQRPVTPALVRAWLRPSGLTATTLAVHRHPDGRLVGAAAVRWPGTPESAGRLWGPIVAPDTRGGGLGSALLSALEEIVAARPGVRVSTVAIAESRPAGWSLYERAGWHASGKATLLALTLPSPSSSSSSSFSSSFPSSVAVRTVRTGEYLDPTIADLVAGVRPERSYASARDTLTRWTSDERYHPDGLLLAEETDAGTGGALLGAALVYPLQQSGHGEPAEARLADLLVAAQLDPARAAQVRLALVAAVVAAAGRLGAAVVRAVVENAELTRALLAAGFEVGDQVRYYARSGTPLEPRSPTTPIETRP